MYPCTETLLYTKILILYLPKRHISLSETALRTCRPSQADRLGGGAGGAGGRSGSPGMEGGFWEELWEVVGGGGQDLGLEGSV